MESILIVMMAPPGVGKTSIAKWIQKNYDDVVIISKNDIEKTNLYSEQDSLLKYYYNINMMLDNHKIVIADDTQISLEDRESLFFSVKKKNIKIVGIWIECSKEQALKANQENRHYSPERIEKDFQFKVSPTKNEPFDNIIYLMRETDAGASKNNPKVRLAIDVLKEDIFLWK